MDHIINEFCYKGTILILGILFFVQFHCTKFGSHNMIMLYPNPCFNKVRYKETTVHLSLDPLIRTKNTSQAHCIHIEEFRAFSALL